ncbi:MAG: hypothetical protein M3P16_00165 [Chloroflexota bacterium]|nr:hypothetical protein [Chloroflexota bacterium]
MDSLYNWVVWIHVVGGFTFALAHGVSAGVAFRLREERDVPRVQALLDLSKLATQGMYVGIYVLLGGGIVAAFMAGFWGRGWIWTAIVILVAMFAFMYARASGYFRDVRRAAGQPYETGKGPRVAEPPNSARLAELLASSRPFEIAGVGYAGLIAILWLMVMKPF